jgi:hypothetical protein
MPPNQKMHSDTGRSTRMAQNQGLDVPRISTRRTVMSATNAVSRGVSTGRAMPRGCRAEGATPLRPSASRVRQISSRAAASCRSRNKRVERPPDRCNVHPRCCMPNRVVRVVASPRATAARVTTARPRLLNQSPCEGTDPLGPISARQETVRSFRTGGCAPCHRLGG